MKNCVYTRHIEWITYMRCILDYSLQKIPKSICFLNFYQLCLCHGVWWLATRVGDSGDTGNTSDKHNSSAKLILKSNLMLASNWTFITISTSFKVNGYCSLSIAAKLLDANMSDKQNFSCKHEWQNISCKYERQNLSCKHEWQNLSCKNDRHNFSYKPELKSIHYRNIYLNAQFETRNCIYATTLRRQNLWTASWGDQLLVTEWDHKEHM